MGKFLHTIDIKASKEKVWDTMLSDETYREWSAPFHEGSFFEGNWAEGSEMRFLAEDDGKLSGMFSKVVKNVPYEYVSLEHLGEIIDGQVDATSDRVKQWSGAHENYTLTEKDGVTTVKVDFEGEGVDEEFMKMFDELWPPALAKLKELAEK